MDKILAVYQENHLREAYGMIKMPRLDGKDRGEFLDNVHCTYVDALLRPFRLCTNVLNVSCCHRLP